MKNQLKVGQVVFAEPHSNALRESKAIIPAIVESVGKKYFTIRYRDKDIPFRNKFSLETMKEVTAYSTDYYIYLTEKEIENKQRKPILISMVMDKIRTFSVEQLENLLNNHI